MKRLRHFLIRISVLSLILLGAATGADALTISKKPYLQNATSAGMVVMWQTDVESDSRVDFGPTSDYTQSVYDRTRKTIHEVSLSGLSPNARYHYRVTSVAGKKRVSSGDNTLPTAVNNGTPFRFAVYGDSRSNPTVHAQVVQAIATGSPRFVLHTADMTADGTIDNNWQTDFFNPAASLPANIPLFPSLGNHENNSSLSMRPTAWIWCSTDMTIFMNEATRMACTTSSRVVEARLSILLTRRQTRIKSTQR